MVKCFILLVKFSDYSRILTSCQLSTHGPRSHLRAVRLRHDWLEKRSALLLYKHK